MSSLQPLIDSITFLNSKKKKEKLEALENLIGLLNQEKIILNLHNNSLASDKSYNWNSLFTNVHNASTAIANEKILKSKQVPEKHIQIVQNIVPLVVQKSVYEKSTLIDSNLLVLCILNVFEEDSWTKLLGSTYVNILTKYVLSDKKSWCSLNAENWIGLKNMCNKSFKNPPPRTPSHIFLEILCDIIKNTSKSCQSYGIFLDLFDFLRDILRRNKKLGLTHEISLLRLTNILCLQSAVEFRYNVCEFMEEVLDFIMDFCGKNNMDINIRVYHFLIIMLSLHNPNGVPLNDKSAYFNDLNKWQNQIKKIFLFCHNELQSILKNVTVKKILPEFMDLLVDISHLVYISDFENFTEGLKFDKFMDEIVPPKKCKYSFDTVNFSNKINQDKAKQLKLYSKFENLAEDLKSADGWFWLQFCEVLIIKYAGDLQNKYGKLISVLNEIICDKKDPENLKISLRCLCYILQSENLTNSNDLKNKNQNEIWNKIGEELVRNLQSENYFEIHVLLRALIRYSKFYNPEPIFKMYCNGILKPCLDNFKTLCCICRYCIIPDVIIGANYSETFENVKETLILWLLQEEKNYPAKDLAKLIISLSVKKFEENEKQFDTANILISHVNINDFCKIIINNFNMVAFKTLKFNTDAELSKENKTEARIDNSTKIKILGYLDVRWQKLYKLLNNETKDFNEQIIFLENSFWFCELLCYLISYVEKSNTFLSDNQILLEKLEFMLHFSTTETVNLLKSKFFNLTSLYNFYASDFHVDVQKLIREPNFINLNLLQYLFEIFANRNEQNDSKDISDYQDLCITSNSKFSNLINSTQSNFHFQNLIKKEKVIVHAVEILCQYITIPGCFESNHFQSTLAFKIVDSLIKDNLTKNSSNFHFQLVFRIVYSFTEYDGISIEVLNMCLDLVLSLFDKKYSDLELFITMLEVLKSFLPTVNRIGNSLTHCKFREILSNLRSAIIIKKNCGIKALSKFLEFLAEISIYDLNGTWAYLEIDGSNYLIFEDVISCLKHPFHEIRLTAAQCVGLLFKTQKNINESTIIWQKKALKKLFLTLKDNESIYFQDKELVFEYSNYVISSISIISWANIICISRFWRKKALFYIIYMAFLKNIKPSNFEDIIKLVCAKLNISEYSKYISYHFSYLFYKWNKKELSIENFPYYLLQYKEFEAFMKNELQSIISVYCQLEQFDKIMEISTKLKTSQNQILRDCYPCLTSFVMPNLITNAHLEIAKKCKKIKKFLDMELSAKASLQYFTDNLDKVIYNMVNNMFDPEYLNNLCDFSGNIKDDKKPLNFNRFQVEETLKSLCVNENNTLLGKIALEVPSLIEKVFVLLLEDIENAFISDHKIFAFYKYIFFVEIVSKATNKSEIYSRINAFIIRDVIYSLSAITKNNNNENLANMACECIKKIADAYLPKFSKIFEEFLPMIASVLTPLALNMNKKALSILNLLICQNYEKLYKAIELLDPFPSNEIFKKINEQIEKKRVKAKNLTTYLKLFIQSKNNKSFGCRIEGLKYLKNILSDKKDDLKEMYENLLNLRGFSEDCKKSLLHQLICVLVELTSFGSVEVRVEAAKCLGELGPSDLTTLVLRPENDLTLFENCNTTIVKFFKIALIHLSNLLISDNFLVKKSASKALYATLSVSQTKGILQSVKNNIKVFEYLEPYVPVSYLDFQLKIKINEFEKKLNEEELWKPDNHEKWIVNLVLVFLELISDSSGIINSYKELVQLNWQFAENILVIILELILTSNEENCNSVISKNFHEFFEFYFNHKNKSPIYLNKKSVQCMLNVIDCIRIRKNQEGIYQESFLKVNYLHVAKAALYCSAYFTSIFYAELWFEEKKKANPMCTDLTTLCELFPEESTVLTETLRECYSKIGNSDGIQGCGYMHILNFSSEIQHYEHIKNWHLSMLHHDVQLSMGNKNFETGLFNSLERSGMIYVLNNMIKAHNISETSSISYKCAAHLSDWTLLDSAYKTANKPQTECFDKHYYFALKAFFNQDDATFQNETFKARETIITELRNCSLESSKNLYHPLSDLRRLTELEEFVNVVKIFSKNNLLELYSKWQKQDAIKYSDFKLIESVWTSRTILIKNVLEKTNDSNIKNSLQSMLCEIYYKIIVAARKEKKYETAIRVLSYVNNIKSIQQEIKGKLNLEKSRILWESGNKDIGKFLLNHCIKKNNINGELKAKSMRIYGDWMVETKSENSHDIIENYYLSSISHFKSNSNNLIDCYASLAKFSDSNYEQLNEYLSSPLFETKRNLINTQNDLASELRQELGWNQNREKKLAYLMASKQVAIDENEIKNNKAERDSYLNLAIKYYLLSLKEGEKYNLLVFRVISLWLNNANNQEVITQLKKTIHQIPTYKFLCLLPQLIPRMADVCLISNLTEQILQDHPHHTLPLLFAISNSYEDLKYSGAKVIPNTSRVIAAKSLLEKFQKDNKLKHFIFEMEQFSTALIELANFNNLNKEVPGIPILFPEHLKIRKIQNFKSVWVPSLHVPYEKNCKYDKIVSIHKFEESFYLVGGVNLPKKITCIGSDGISRTLLIKGKDDLRQDAVMQQVFGIINSLLFQNIETKKRKLIMRTYKVVPLSQRSGIIEWCENTQPLALYLTGPDGKSGAHKKFNPKDILAFECRCRMKKVFSLPEVTNEDKLKVFLDICKEFHPAFHYFFLEKFPSAGVWFERRLAYTHSIATSSMIGYILGIGDRHVLNILIDNLTAECIHIDLGIAFEQGKILPTPETVPFRLTRDIVDGMGLNGVEGDFRISCIKTMEVLRNNQDTILTLLEVLLYDPLYTWTITPEKAYSIQGHTESVLSTTDRSSPDVETNKMAERALIRLKQKLQGIDTTNCMATNVDGQVSYLIQQARDPKNLCRLFHGWQAYL